MLIKALQGAMPFFFPAIYSHAALTYFRSFNDGHDTLAAAGRPWLLAVFGTGSRRKCVFHYRHDFFDYDDDAAFTCAYFLYLPAT